MIPIKIRRLCIKSPLCLLHALKPGPLSQVRVNWLCLAQQPYKSEARNSKQYPMLQIQMSKTSAMAKVANNGIIFDIWSFDIYPPLEDLSALYGFKFV
jgi:hypothetical protein